jgi:CO/xanthine dehydrogenase FAD-binding subunit
MSHLYRLKEYHRPSDLDEALHLLRRKNTYTVILAGGVTLMGEGLSTIESMVDLSGLGLDSIKRERNTIHLGALVTLQQIVENLQDVASGVLAVAARQTAGLHTRNIGTIGGLLASADLHAPLSIVMAALGSRVKMYEQSGEIPLWQTVCAQARRNSLRKHLITSISFTVPDHPYGMAYTQVGRTPADRPIVGVAGLVSRQSADEAEISVAIGGLTQDLVAVSGTFNRTQLANLAECVHTLLPSKYSDTLLISDHLGSSDYRRSMSSILTERAIASALNSLA